MLEDLFGLLKNLDAPLLHEVARKLLKNLDAPLLHEVARKLYSVIVSSENSFVIIPKATSPIF